MKTTLLHAASGEEKSVDRVEITANSPPPNADGTVTPDHWQLSFYERHDHGDGALRWELIDTASFNSKDAAMQHAALFGADKFNEFGAWFRPVEPTAKENPPEGEQDPTPRRKAKVQ